MPLSIGPVDLFMGPSAVGAPDDLRAAIVGFIEGAQRRLRVAVQEIEDREVTEALIEAKRRGVTTQVMVESSYLGRHTDDDEPAQVGHYFRPDAEFLHNSNRLMLEAMLRAGIDVKLDLNPKIMHQKFAVRDSDAVLTGSTNWTPTGLDRNLNHVVVVHDRNVTKDYRKEFEELWDGSFGVNRPRRDPKPNERWTQRADDTGPRVPVKVLFAPDHGPEMEVMKQMLKARSTIDFAIFTFAQSSGIDDTMRSVACGSGAVGADAGAEVHVRGSFDGGQSAHDWAAARSLLGRDNIELHRSHRRGSVGKLHHKLMVIDEQLIIAGSFNYTAPATTLNDENIIVIGNLETADDMPSLAGRSALIPESIEAQQELAGYAKDEMSRIVTEHTVPLR